MPTIQWDKNLQYIFNNDSDSSRFHILENGTLHIVEIHLDDEGAYGCTIGSSAGLKREEIRLIVKGTLAQSYFEFYGFFNGISFTSR